RAVVVEEDFGEFEFPMEKAAAARVLLRANEKGAKVLKLVDVEVATSKFARAFFYRLHSDLLKLLSIFPRADFVGINVEQIEQSLVVALLQVVAEKARRPKIRDAAKWPQRGTQDRKSVV